MMGNRKVRLIALYLPQFYPFPENDAWWGKGFTEWTNVGKAKPLFKGHYQPRIPADLGYYDLRVPETRQAQADMAKSSGIEGFAYWHYWFGNGKRLLERPFNEVLNSGKPDFPFCLAWANHSWYEKIYTLGGKNRLLIEQKYPGIEDYKAHFYSVLPAFQDQRYIRVEGKPVFILFSPLDSSEVKVFVETWRNLAKENNLQGFYFIGQGKRDQKQQIMSIGFDAFSDNSVSAIYYQQPKINRILQKLKTKFTGIPRVYKYAEAMKYFNSDDGRNIETIPSIIPNWDHSPRSGKKGFILHNSNPTFFKKHVDNVLSLLKDKPFEHRIAIIKSWNEWGESNYLEPDLKYGLKYLEALKESIDGVDDRNINS